MVDVEFQPIRKVIVHEAMKYDFNEFVERYAIQPPPGIPPAVARWTDGIIFVFNTVQPTPELINERIHDGVIHWDFLIFAEMPDFQNVVTHPDTHAQLRISDNTNNSAVTDVIRHFKNDPTYFPPGA